jgi:uncharacterized protein (DUF885 family)
MANRVPTELLDRILFETGLAQLEDLENRLNTLKHRGFQDNKGKKDNATKNMATGAGEDDEDDWVDEESSEDSEEDYDDDKEDEMEIQRAEGFAEALSQVCQVVRQAMATGAPELGKLIEEADRLINNALLYVEAEEFLRKTLKSFAHSDEYPMAKGGRSSGRISAYFSGCS